MIDEDGEPVAPELRPEAIVARTGKPAHQSLGVPTDDGTLRWLRVSAHPIERPNGERWVVASYRDVSEHRKVEAELALSVAADRAKSEFLSRMSHELRTPLNVMLGFAQLLQMDELAPTHQESVEQILTAGRHLLELVEEVLDLERIGRGRLEVALRPIPVREALREALELVQQLAEANGVTVEMRNETEPTSVAVANSVRLRQVLLNLLTNAIKYNHRGGRVTLSGREIAGMIVVRVRDTGPGIPPDQLDADLPALRTARRRRAGDRRRRRRPRPLSAARRSDGWADGGRFDARCGKHLLVRRTRREPGRVDQVAAVAEPLSPAHRGELARRAAEGPPRRLLYIEDNTASRTLLEQLVAHRGGFDMVGAESAGEGLRLACRTAFDAVLVDLHLPDGSGEDVVRGLRADPEDGGHARHRAHGRRDTRPARCAARHGRRRLPHQAARRVRVVRHTGCRRPAA